MKKPQRDLKSWLPLIFLVVAVLVIVAASFLFASDLFGSPDEQVVESSQLITPSEYQQDFGAGSEHVLIDVRTPDEFASGYIYNAINIAVETLEDRLDEVPNDIPIVVYCRSGNRSAVAAEILVSAGYQPVYDLGGIKTWIEEGYPVEE